MSVIVKYARWILINVNLYVNMLYFIEENVFPKNLIFRFEWDIMVKVLPKIKLINHIHIGDMVT